MAAGSGPPEDPEALKRLVDRALHGDADAWSTLYARLRPRLFAFCLRRLGSREDAEDAVAETMMRAVRSAGQFRWRGAGFDAWIFRICKNVIIDMTRSRSRQTALVGRGERPLDPASVEEEVALGEERAAVRRAFDHLSQDDRELLELRVVAGLSSEEAAYVLRRRPGAVRVAQSRALKRLRTYLAEEDQ
jgi:RNA polymerase sigma-70 factor (ECF subfamily)